MGDGQCDEIWRNFATLRQNFKSLDPFFQGLFSILSSVEPTLEKLGEFPLLQTAKYWENKSGHTGLTTVSWLPTYGPLFVS